MSADGVRVYIWPYGGLGHFGHAAVRLKHGSLPGGKCYISWWPGGGGLDNSYNTKKNKVANPVLGKLDKPMIYQTLAQDRREYVHDRVGELSERARQGLSDGTFQPKTGQREIDVGFQMGQDLMQEGVPVRSVYDPVAKTWGEKVWVQDPVKTAIPALGEPNVKVGLDVAKIFTWWQVFSQVQKNWYRLMSTKRNCAGVAALALRAGGAAKFAKPPTAFFFMEPNHVQDWVNRINTKLAKLNASAKTVVQAASSYVDLKNTEIMTAAEWKTASNVGVSKLAIRSSATKKIDQLMQQYWALGWGADSVSHQAKIAILSDIMDACHEYLVTRAGNKRSDAVVTLGDQALAAINCRPDPGTAPTADWDT